MYSPWYGTPEELGHSDDGSDVDPQPHDNAAAVNSIDKYCLVFVISMLSI
jgi:hypothetical protein